MQGEGAAPHGFAMAPPGERHHLGQAAGSIMAQGVHCALGSLAGERACALGVVPLPWALSPRKRAARAAQLASPGLAEPGRANDIHTLILYPGPLAQLLEY